jgi:hypothetical protein
MNTHDDLDDRIAEQLRGAAPTRAPQRLFDATMDRVTATPQRGGAWFSGRAARLLTAVAVILLAVAGGAQLSGLIGRNIGTEPSLAPSVVPSSATAEPSGSVAASATPVATAQPAAADELILRVTFMGGGPMYPTSLLPWVSLMADGTLVWQPVPPEAGYPSLLTRRLNAEGLAQLREIIFSGGLLNTNATHELEPLPGAQPPGRGVGVFTFTNGESQEDAVVSSVQWLGDEEEQTYYQPSPAREALDALAQALRDPESMLDEGAWEGPAEPYEGADYQLVLMPQRDVPPYGNPDVADLPLTFDGPIDEFGEAIGGQGALVSRCGIVTREEAAGIVAVFDAGDFGEVGMDRATSGGLDWADGNGTVDVSLLPRMPDGFPECSDQG